MWRRFAAVAAVAVLVSAESGVAVQGRGPAQGREKVAVKRESPAQGRDKAAAQRESPAQGRDKAAAQRESPAQGRDKAAVKRESPAQGRDKAAGGNRGGGDALVRAGRGRLSAAEVRARVAELPPDVRRYGESGRTSDRMVVEAVARGVARGTPGDRLNLRVVGDRVSVRNARGDVLLELSEERARNLGAWQMRMLGDRRPTGNAPSFCRSGAGHPVWGREWCLDKGFGLGHANRDMIWSRGTIGDIIFGRTIDRNRLERPDLMSVLGDVVFGRLALHALTLGFTDPLVGVYVAEPDAPRLLRLQSGGVEVAELVDLNGDNRVDVMYVTQYR